MCFAPFTKIPKVIEIQHAKNGDIIRTSRGDWPLTKLIKTHTGTKPKEYVKFNKNCLGCAKFCLPRNDLYVTGAHPINLAFIPNKWLIKDFDETLYDEYTCLQITTSELVGKLPGISISLKSFGAQYQMVFDDHTSVDTEGIDCLSHHPRCTPLIVPKDDFHKPEMFNSKSYHHTVITFDELLKFKPKDMDLQIYIRKCITHDQRDKFDFTEKLITKHLGNKQFQFINKLKD